MLFSKYGVISVAPTRPHREILFDYIRNGILAQQILCLGNPTRCMSSYTQTHRCVHTHTHTQNIFVYANMECKLIFFGGGMGILIQQTPAAIFEKERKEGNW